MNCKHERLMCTDNRFFCLVCGAEVASPHEADKQEGQEERTAETQKTGRKRKARKEAE
jgi:hypothetical protein